LLFGHQAGVSEMTLLAVLSNRAFWNMKIKIAILTLATFIAMC
jgi:hypothetical protein